MKILITGGTGFVGEGLCKALREAGHELVVLTRNPSRARSKNLFTAKFVPWEAGLQIAPPEAFEKVQGVFHLAGASLAEGRWTFEKKQELYNSRVLGTENLLKGLLQSGVSPAWMISFSAVGFYGSDGEILKDESSPKGSGFLADLCNAWEERAQSFPNQIPGLRLCILRLGMVLGEKGGMLAKVLPIFKKGLGASLGSGRQSMSWIQEKDLVRLCFWCMNNPQATGIYNATAPQPLSNKELHPSWPKL